MKLSSAFILSSLVQLFVALGFLMFTTAPLLPSAMLIGVAIFLMASGFVISANGG